MPLVMTYIILVTTGDQSLGGTDSNVFIQLFGDARQTEPVFLPPQDIFAFESGSTDKFVLEVEDLGELTRCCIGHDNSEGDSGWFVDNIRIQHEESKREWEFVFKQWLGIEESGNLSACVSI